jgi:hypothetical protein
MNVHTTTGPVSPYSFRALMAPMTADTSAASSAKGNNHHEAGATLPDLSSEKEGSTETMLGR